MVSVDAVTYLPNMQVVFKNCVFTVTGKVFYSNLPVNLLFDNCTFNVENTTNLVTLDYSGYCNTTDKFGDLKIQNSVFKDSSTYSTTTTTQKQLFNVMSLYDVSFNNVSFLNMKNSHLGWFQDYICQALPKV